MKTDILLVRSAGVRPDDGTAFLPDPFARGRSGHVQSKDSLADELGQQYVSSVTSGEDVATEQSAARTSEELGGPFLVTSAQSEYGATVNEAHPPGGEREAVPTLGGTADSTDLVRSEIEKNGS